MPIVKSNKGIVIPERIEVVLVMVLGNSISLKFIISPAKTAYRTGVFNRNLNDHLPDQIESPIVKWRIEVIIKYITASSNPRTPKAKREIVIPRLPLFENTIGFIKGLMG